jgi:uncharacterized coiled-coil protein SlyX
MTRQTIDKLNAEVKQLKAQLDRQAHNFQALRIKLGKQERANAALEAREQALLARIAKMEARV